MYAVGWATNTVVLTDKDFASFQEMTLESVLELFEQHREIYIATGIRSGARVLDMKVVERRGRAIAARLSGAENPSVLPENVQVLIRRPVAKMSLPEAFGYTVPVNLYSSPFYVKAAALTKHDLVATSSHVSCQWLGDNVRKLTGACSYVEKHWVKYAAKHPRLPLRNCIIPGTDRDFDGIITSRSGKVWLKVANLAELHMDSLVAMTVDAPGGVICDGAIVQAMVGSRATVQ